MTAWQNNTLFQKIILLSIDALKFARVDDYHIYRDYKNIFGLKNEVEQLKSEDRFWQNKQYLAIGIQKHYLNK